MLSVLPGQIQAADLQQGVPVPGLGHRAGLGAGSGLHDLHSHGGRHQDPPIRRAADRGKPRIVQSDRLLVEVIPKLSNRTGYCSR